MKKGFTLLEVMVALGILGVSLVVLLTAQSRSMNMAQKARSLTIATQLARAKLYDCRAELLKDGFAITDFSKSGDFSDDHFDGYSWECRGYPYNLPPPNSDMMAKGLKAGQKAGLQGDAAASMLAPFFSMLSGALKDSIREMVVFVRWKEGKTDQELRITTHVIEKKAIAALLGAMPGLPGASGAQPGPAQPPGPAAPPPAPRPEGP